MSLDYPSRAHWLKVREARNEPLVAKYVHVAKRLLTVYNDKLRTVETIIAPGRGTTFRREEAKNPSRRDIHRGHTMTEPRGAAHVSAPKV